ncbi:Ark-family serine/threonine protein kinase [Scheffersomyces stipitis CBS 6054]|uniref:Ark-family serine/threonine protein kinase n=1 Tax=Scheffersomyces stipitis (strain ATCC 58785 / CBS 6054 / NBRC 10063 / NRRL Y-11545) TaxID=322104 RepID=A3LW96_PICST|nr:Ark-family serine/threonine protein kinase [Scheffersomyces stipitis CBS 6054]ABN66929.2 Ark-family serine/threonine protein kinase [Scheffersomyces stipitis CBS 6054]
MGNFPKLPDGTELPVGSHKVTIVKYLSEGGFAHIYKVEIDPPEEDSNIACLKRVIVPDKNGLNLLRKEVDVMKTLRHGRNIVKYYDSHAERLDNGTYQVLVLMELCPNKSLLDYMNAHIKTKLSESQILTIMNDIALGLYEMHRLKLIHRDIKIENVLIDSKHAFKLCDFGSTSSPIMPPKDQIQFQALSHDILYQTTPQYRAPEMLDLYRGFPIDEKADIWALGCFLYKLCYYTTPFEANGDIAILHASFQFPSLPAYSGDLKNLIIIMLQENPLFRPNVVQVLMLVSKMKDTDFSSLNIEDIYNAGGYNFHALHDYQRHKQNELLQRQQLYYQQQSLAASVSHNASMASLPTVSDSLKVPQVSKVISNSSSHSAGPASESVTPQRSHSRSETSNMKSDGSLRAEGPLIKVDNSSVDLSNIDNLDNAEERYPTLDSLLNETDTAPTVEAVKEFEPNPVPSAHLHVHPPQQPKLKAESEEDVSIPEPPLGKRASIEKPNTFENDTDIYVSSAKPMVSSISQSTNPFPTVENPVVEISKSDMDIVSSGESKKDSNPWGEFRSNVPRKEPSENSHMDYSVPVAMNNEMSLPLPTEDISTSLLNPAEEFAEANLIDLDVGLDSSSSSVATPILLPKTRINNNNKDIYKLETEMSLLDLEIEEDTVNLPIAPGGSSHQPPFKKRVSSGVPSGSKFNFQEEVIDFASDDENPENGSKMNRISIRKSLKKPKSRKSGEHKRTDSSASEGKKRLSFFGGSLSG